MPRIVHCGRGGQIKWDRSSSRAIGTLHDRDVGTNGIRCCDCLMIRRCTVTVHFVLTSDVRSTSLTSCAILLSMTIAITQHILPEPLISIHRPFGSVRLTSEKLDARPTTRMSYTISPRPCLASTIQVISLSGSDISVSFTSLYESGDRLDGKDVMDRLADGTIWFGLSVVGWTEAAVE